MEANINNNNNKKKDTHTRPDVAGRSVATVDSGDCPIDCHLTDLYTFQKCSEHARNSPVLPEEEVRLGLVNYALVL
jgi:hypothetical protein